MDEYTGAESPYDDGTNAPHVDWYSRWWTGHTGGNRDKTLITADFPPGRYTVTKQEYDRGERP